MRRTTKVVGILVVALLGYLLWPSGESQSETATISQESVKRVSARDKWLEKQDESSARAYVTEVVKTGKADRLIKQAALQYGKDFTSLDPERIKTYGITWNHVAEFLDSAVAEESQE